MIGNAVWRKLARTRHHATSWGRAPAHPYSFLHEQISLRNSNYVVTNLFSRLRSSKNQYTMSTLNLSAIERLVLLVKVSRVPGWCFGPILFTIGVIHARAIPRSVIDLIRYVSMVFCLSFPLCIGTSHIGLCIAEIYSFEFNWRQSRVRCQRCVRL